MRRFTSGIVVSAIMVLAVSMVSSPAHSQPQDQIRVLIGFKSAPGLLDELQMEGHGAEILYVYSSVHAMALSVPLAALDSIRANPNVDVVEADIRVSVVDAELDAAWGVGRIRSELAHSSGVTGAGINVAVIDTGIDCTHPDLDRNCVGGYDFVNNDNDPSDDNGHGTHVAGTIAGEDNNSGVVGVAPDASLYGLKVLNSGGGGWWSDIIAAIEWTADNGIHVTNNSYGSGGHPGSIVEAVFASTAARGVLHIAAAGNSGTCAGTENTVGYPGRFASVVSVAATMSSDARACFSSTGPTVEVAAPGVSINSTRVGGGYVRLSGTSMASPHVAGVAALVLSSGIASSVDEARARLSDTAFDLGVAGRDTHFGFGLVDAYDAINAPPPNGVPDVTITGPTSGSRLDSDVTVTLTAAASDAEDGDLSADIEWTSDVDGPLGTGASIVVSLSEGEHRIEASALDTAGESGTDTVLLTIAPPPLPDEVRVAAVTYATRDLGRPKNPLDVTVHVVDAANRPVAGARVVVKIKRRSRVWRRKGFTGPDGTVTVTIGRSPRGCYFTNVRRVKAAGLTWDRVRPANEFCQ